MLHDSVIAAIRTGCAALVTLLIAWLGTALGVHLPTDTSTALAGALFVVAIAVYNWVVIWLSAHVSPLFGYLLGVPKRPTYSEKNADGSYNVTSLGATASASPAKPDAGFAAADALLLVAVLALLAVILAATLASVH